MKNSRNKCSWWMQSSIDQSPPEPECLFSREAIKWKEIPIPECTQISVDINQYISTLDIETTFLINQILCPKEI